MNSAAGAGIGAGAGEAGISGRVKLLTGPLRGCEWVAPGNRFHKIGVIRSFKQF